MYIYMYIYIRNRPTQTIIYVPLMVNRFQKRILLIVQYKYLKSCPGDFILQNLILRTRSCEPGVITQSSWVFHFHPTIMVGWKFFVPQFYQFRNGISGGAALKYFYPIHPQKEPCKSEEKPYKSAKEPRVSRHSPETSHGIYMCTYIYIYIYIYIYA